MILTLAADLATVEGQDPPTGLGERTTVRTAQPSSGQNCPYFFLCAAQNIPVVGGIFREK